jgi:hypothetical protein
LEAKVAGSRPVVAAVSQVQFRRGFSARRRKRRKSGEGGGSVIPRIHYRLQNSSQIIYFKYH